MILRYPAIVLAIIFFGCCTSKNTTNEKSTDTTMEVTTADVDSGIAVVSDTSMADTTESEEIKSSSELDLENISYAGEQVFIYKMKKDYSKNVPVTLSADKSRIVSYPSPGDVYRNGKLAMPEKLEGGFWLDNRGINPNTAFLNITYEDYAKLKEAPLLADMMKTIEDKDPVTEIYSLGTRSRWKNEKKDFNEIIQRDALRKFKKIK